MSPHKQLSSKRKRFFILKLSSGISLILATPVLLSKLLYQWIKRLPRRFSYTITVIAVVYFSGATLLSAIFVGWVTEMLPGSSLWTLALRTTIIFAFMLVLFLITLLFPLVMLGELDKFLWPKPTPQKFKIYEPVLPQPLIKGENEDKTLGPYKKIGIILSGGGAKGAYQAGALKAIYEFIEKNNAHDKVKMIAATSIGSWNALFWLAGLIKDNGQQKGLLEQWWSRINIQNIISLKSFWPMRQNHLLSNKPWQETFEAFFGEGNPKACEQLLKSKINFYFTRSNVGTGRLEFATNRSDLVGGAKARAHVIDNPESLSKAVFCSMDIPPLFEYTREVVKKSNDKDEKEKSDDMEQSFFEDGGVINNLPILFGTEYEECDLLFILPLNASFEQEVDERSITKRLFRVMDVRQGVLERNSFKMINLYNELAALRKKYGRDIEKLQQNLPTSVETAHDEALLEPAPSSQSDRPVDVAIKPEFHAEEKSALKALNRKHEVIRVFAICPAPELTINTTEFWKTEEAQGAFQLMYRTTKTELENKFGYWVKSDRVRMALVMSDGKLKQLVDGEVKELDASYAQSGQI